MFRLLTEEELAEIWNTTIRDVILRTNPQMEEYDIQDEPFLWDGECHFFLQYFQKR